ncbi:MAG: lyase family protein [Patescibacteria group bacterium]|jgi:adenylosuccinate lyase
MKRIWTLRKKFELWLKVELTILKARVMLGMLEEEKYQRIRRQAKFTLKEIDAREKEIDHDLQAFVDTCRKYLPPELQAEFHKMVTSFDIEDPAQALMLLMSHAQIIARLDGLIAAVHKLASEHIWTYCMGITHGQDGKVITYAARVVVYLDGLKKSRETLMFLQSQLAATKCSGAMGTYGDSLTPELEAKVCELLHLTVRPAASQIILRDAIARYVSEIAILGCVLEKMAFDNFLLGQSGYREIIEPRRKGQKGSSAMPHKKNTIKNEQIRGMVRLLRAYAMAVMEDIATAEEREISQSSVERIALPDATILLDYMLNSMTKVISGMEVRRDQMVENISRIQRCWASEAAKTAICDALCRPGSMVTPDQVYYFIQKCAFIAMESHIDFKDALLNARFPDPDVAENMVLRKLIDPVVLEPCFDFKTSLEQNMPIVYERNGLDPSLALEPNC